MWAITLSFRVDLDEPALTSLAQSLRDQVGASVDNVAGRGIDVTVFKPGVDELQAARAVREQLADFVPGDLCGVQILTEDVYRERADKPVLPQLVSGPDAAKMLHITRQRLHQLRQDPQFPLPVLELRTGPIWAKDAIDRFGKYRDRRRSGQRPVVKTTATVND